MLPSACEQVALASNRDLFARLQRIDRPMTALVLGTLYLTALIPVSVRVSVPSEGARGNAFQFYALLIMLGGTLNVLLWVYASIRSGLMSRQVSRTYRIRRVVEAGTLPLLFAVIFLMPTVATLRWIAMLLIAVLMLRRFLLRGFFAEPESPPP